MSTNKDTKDFLLQEIDIVDNITARPMMGEYLLYKDGVLFGGIYDERILVKIVDTNEKYNLEEVIPYKGAKPMYYLEKIDDKDLVRDVIIDTYVGVYKKTKK